MKIDNEPLTSDDLVIRRQLIASFFSLILLFIGILISPKYGILGFSIPAVYIGVSSIKNRISIVVPKGQMIYMSRGTRAIVMGIIIIIFSLVMAFSVIFND